ncbi:MAG: aromatic-L-amino-acid/L-tryptophan decarboxylase [Acidobacteriota bacterium]|jgi:aromatic-L-amino-acid decarboxylase|nr:aromatic-L-amino-acid/L-tryptophan decarboxylase [Acidobacteriota bacterium]
MSEAKNSRVPDTVTIAAEHERLGRVALRIISDHARTLDDAPVCSTATPAELEELFDEPLPQEGLSAEEIFATLSRDVIPHAMNIPSPRYFGLFNPTPLPIAIWMDAVASALNQNGAVWRNSPSANVVEARVLRWLCRLVGYGEESFGTLTSGGSEANLIALKCARDRAVERARERGLRSASILHSASDATGNTVSDATKNTVSGATGNLVVYASEQCHYSFVKSVDILGLGRENLRKIDTDERFHIRMDLLREAIQSDIAAGHTPVCIAGAAGATSTGIVDPLDELADVAREFKLWFHVDAAYGGALAFSEKHKWRLRGIERAESVSFDPHKWMFVPFECGALLVRDGGRVLREAFDITPEYLSEERGGSDVEFDSFRYGQLGTRRAMALKVWAALKSLGVRGYAEIIERQIELVNYMASRFDATEEFERVGEVETALCCVRFLPREARQKSAAEQDELQRALQQRVERSGGAWLATTVLNGRRALRINVNSFLTERRHIDYLLELLRREGAKLVHGE